MGRFETTIYRRGHGTCSGRLPGCLLSVSIGSRRKKTRSGKRGRDPILRVGSGSLWFGLWATPMVQTGCSTIAFGTGLLLGQGQAAMLCGRPHSGHHRHGQNTALSGAGAAIVAVAGIGMQAELGETPERKQRPMDWVPTSADRARPCGNAGARQAGKVGDNHRKHSAAQWCGASEHAENSCRIDGLVNINHQVGPALGRHAVGSYHRMREQGRQASKSAQEFGLLEASSVRVGDIAAHDQRQFAAGHIPLGAPSHVDGANRCISQRLWGHPLAWKPPSGMVGRCHKPGGHQALASRDREPCVAIGMGIYGRDHIPQGIRTTSERRSLLPPHRQYRGAQCSALTQGQITWHGDLGSENLIANWAKESTFGQLPITWQMLWVGSRKGQPCLPNWRQ